MKLKRKILFIAILIFFIAGTLYIPSPLATYVSAMDGAGTEANPYLIKTPADLQAIGTGAYSLSAHYKLNNDINMTSISNFTPLGKFSGTLDGNFKNISNLKISANAINNVGLFSETNGATIKNLGLVNAIVTSTGSDIAILVGNDDGGTSVSRTYVTGTVSGGAAVGGFFGSTHGSSNPTTIEDSYVRANLIRGSHVKDTSGFAGWNYATSISITNSYSASIGEVRPIAGWSDGSVVNISRLQNTYYDKTLSPSLDSGHVSLGKTSEQLKTQSTFEGWDFGTIWDIDSNINGGYPFLRGFTSELIGSPGTLTVLVKDGEGTPVEDATVVIRNKANPVDTVTLPHQSGGNYSNTILSTGAKTYEILINGTPSGEITIPAGSSGSFVEEKTLSSPVDPNQEAVNQAKIEVEAGSFSFSQSTANTESASKTELVRQINILLGNGTTGVTVTVGDIEILSGFEPAVKGDGITPNGTNGSFKFTVNLRKELANTKTNQLNGSIIATEAEVLTGTAIITGDAIWGETLVASLSDDSNDTGVLSYRWERGDANISGATGSSYQLVAADVGEEISVVISTTGQKGSLTSAKSASVAKATQTAPGVPTIEITFDEANEKYTATIIPNAADSSGKTYQYRFDNGVDEAGWKSVTTHEISLDNTSVTGYIRFAETNTHFASYPASTTRTTGTDIADTTLIENAEAVVVNGSVTVPFGATQADITRAVQSYVNGKLTGELTGVSASVSYNAVANTYTVTFTRGEVTSTKVLSMIVQESPDPDLDAVNNIASSISNFSLPAVPQSLRFNSVAQLNSYVESLYIPLSATDPTVSVSIIESSLVLPIAGTAANPLGTDGKYSFQVRVAKNAQVQNISEELIIKASIYVPIDNSMPETGDAMPITMLSLLMLLSVLGISSIYYWKKEV